MPVQYSKGKEQEIKGKMERGWRDTHRVQGLAAVVAAVPEAANEGCACGRIPFIWSSSVSTKSDFLCFLASHYTPSVHGPTPTRGIWDLVWLEDRDRLSAQGIWMSSGKELVLGGLVHLGNCMIFIDCVYCQCLYPILRFLKTILVPCCSEKVYWRHQFTESTEMCTVRSHAPDCGLLGRLGAGVGLVEGGQGEQIQYCSLSLGSTLMICSL